VRIEELVVAGAFEFENPVFVHIQSFGLKNHPFTFNIASFAIKVKSFPELGVQFPDMGNTFFALIRGLAQGLPPLGKASPGRSRGAKRF